MATSRKNKRNNDLYNHDERSVSTTNFELSTDRKHIRLEGAHVQPSAPLHLARPPPSEPPREEVAEYIPEDLALPYEQPVSLDEGQNKIASTTVKSKRYINSVSDSACFGLILFLTFRSRITLF